MFGHVGLFTVCLHLPLLKTSNMTDIRARLLENMRKNDINGTVKPVWENGQATVARSLACRKRICGRYSRMRTATEIPETSIRTMTMRL